MMPPAMPHYRVRLYRRTDRAAVREICIATAWMGEPGGERIADDWIWAEYWTRYFTDREPCHCWVAEDTSSSRVIGYLTGTASAARFESYVPFVLPSIIGRVILKRLLWKAASRRAILSTLRSLARGELAVRHSIVRNYPATLHLNLLPAARGHGLGFRLAEAFLDAMRSEGVPGVHAQTLSLNEGIAHFNRRLGFQPVQSQPILAFAHATTQPVHLVTWVMPLSGKCRMPSD